MRIRTRIFLGIFLLLGIGIPDYARERGFERFYLLKRPATGKKSWGLELSLVQEIVLLHRGSIALTPHPEGGTLAVLTLPIACK